MFSENNLIPKIEVTNQEQAAVLEVKISPELETEIHDFYKQYFDSKYTGVNVASSSELRTLREKSRVEGEKTFFVRVLSSIHKAHLENPNKEIDVLFDLDETLVKSKSTNNERHDTLRPTAVPLLEKIQSLGFRSGLLTSRFDLENQLTEGSNLTALKRYFDQGLLVSTKDVFVGFEELKTIKESLPEELQFAFSNGDYAKMKVLTELQQKNPDIIFIPVDDFKYPSVVPYGVALENNEMFSL